MASGIRGRPAGRRNRAIPERCEVFDATARHESGRGNAASRRAIHNAIVLRQVSLASGAV